ncbi:MAG TPA: urease accessory protein UreE [Candidatus Acidoferrum sp.]|nr:urease accessory protein UreE [Candidatus Acidoferrum sp.]
MRNASIHRFAGHWPEEKAADTLTLDFDARHRRRIRLTTDHGEDVLLDLPKTVAMANGDGLQLDDGTWLRITAASESLVEVRHKDRHRLMRLAWHLGNRHLPTEICEDSLRIRPDHVIEEMLQGFGASIHKVHAAFQPEGGAYRAAHNHDHHHHDGHHHDHENDAHHHA